MAFVSRTLVEYVKYSFDVLSCKIRYLMPRIRQVDEVEVDRRLSIKLVKDGLFTPPAAAKTPLTIKLAPSPHFAMGQMGFTS